MTAPYKEGDFEKAIEAHLLANDWLSSDRDNYNRKLGLDTVELDAFIADTQSKNWDQLVANRFQGDADKARQALHETVAKLLDSGGALKYLRSGVTVRGLDFDLAYFRPAMGLTPQLNKRYAKNRVTVTRQLYYSLDNDNSLDLVLFVNGIPVATVELKNKLTQQTVEHAKKQYREDREPTERLFAKRAVVHLAVDTDAVYLTTQLAGEHTRFLPFNQGHEYGAGNPPAEQGKYATSYLWERVWERDAWMDVLRRFVHSQTEDNQKTVIFPRYHQWDAVVKTLAHARENRAGHDYLIEHSAGSGKSNTIAWLAHRLALLHDADDKRVFNKVVIVTDRLALDRQLGDTVYQFEHVPGLVERAKSGSAALAKALNSTTARIVLSTLQKFPFVLDKLADMPEERYAVIIDEAHSSQGGEAAKALREALGAAAAQKLAEEDSDADEADASETEVQDLIAESVKARGKQPNLSYFAFTATPTRRTLELFGTDQGNGVYAPFHVYSMKQAIDEEFILDVLKQFMPYSVLWKVASNSKSDQEVDKSKATQAIVSYVTQHASTLKEKARIIVEHCHGTVAQKINGKAKAMVVTSSRVQAVLTYFAIKKYAEAQGYEDCKPLVAFSDSITVDGEDWTETKLNGFPGGEVPERFNTDEYRILVVAEKYQTGFDQPLLHTMYVDKKLTGIRAVQTLSRLNRIHPNKDDTFVLDFVNEGADMKAAFEKYYEVALTEATDPAELYVAHGALTDFGLIAETDETVFAGVFLAGGDDPTAHAQLLGYLQPTIQRFQEADEDVQKSFRAALLKFVDMYGFLAQAVAFTDARLEAAYLYGRHLQRALPKEHSGTLDLGGDILLTHLRFEVGAEENVSPKQGADPTGAETGEVVEPVQPAIDYLSQIIQSINERHGSMLDGDDRVILEHVLGGMAANPGLVQEAHANSKENFLLVFSEPFEDKVMQTETSNKSFFERFFSDEEFHDDVVRNVGEEFHRRHGGDDQLAA